MAEHDLYFYNVSGKKLRKQKPKGSRKAHVQRRCKCQSWTSPTSTTTNCSCRCDCITILTLSTRIEFEGKISHIPTYLILFKDFIMYIETHAKVLLYIMIHIMQLLLTLTKFLVTNPLI